MGSTSSHNQTYADDNDDNDDDDHRRVAPMGRTPRKARETNDDIFVVGAGNSKTNGRYKKVYLTSKPRKAKCGGKGGHLAEKNGASVYRNIFGFEISRDIIDDEAGWALGRHETTTAIQHSSQVYYAVLDSSFLPPPRLWSKTWQCLGIDPCPNIALHLKDAIALGYDELREAELMETVAFEKEQKKMEGKEAKKIRQALKKMKPNKSDSNKMSEGSRATTTTGGVGTGTDPKQTGSKWNVVRSSLENKGDDSFMPVSPSMASYNARRAQGRRQRPQALAWQTPEKGTSLKKTLKDDDGLPELPQSPVLRRAIEMSATTHEERTERFTAKREERYQYYQKRLTKNVVVKDGEEEGEEERTVLGEVSNGGGGKKNKRKKKNKGSSAATTTQYV